MGDVAAQTLAGALQTGSHGTGRTSGAVATQVVALELVLADGRVVTVPPDSDSDLFAAARVGLGAFGILTAVTLQTTPAFLLHARVEARRLDDVLGHLDQWWTDHDHVQFSWFPQTRNFLLTRNNRTEGPAAALGPVRSWVDDRFLTHTVFGALNRLARAAPRLVPRINAAASKVLPESDHIDSSWRVFTSPSTIRNVEQEYAIPRECVLPAIRDLADLIDRNC